MTYERKKEIYDFAMKNADESIKKADEQQRYFDSTILKFSAGAFALSFSIINTFIPLDSARFKFSLFLSWLSFTLSIASGLFSYLLAVKKHTYDYDFELKRYEFISAGKEEPVYNKRWFFVCGWLNSFNFIFFLSGIICLLFFVFKNI